MGGKTLRSHVSFDNRQRILSERQKLVPTYPQRLHSVVERKKDDATVW